MISEWQTYCARLSLAGGRRTGIQRSSPSSALAVNQWERLCPFFALEPTARSGANRSSSSARALGGLSTPVIFRDLAQLSDISTGYHGCIDAQVRTGSTIYIAARAGQLWTPPRSPTGGVGFILRQGRYAPSRFLLPSRACGCICVAAPLCHKSARGNNARIGRCD